MKKKNVCKYCVLLFTLFFMCIGTMLTGLYTYSRSHVTVEAQDVQYVSVKNTHVVQKIYCEGKISNLGIMFYAPSGSLYGDAEVTISVSQGDRVIIERIKATRLRTASAYYVVEEGKYREENSRYEMCYVMRENLWGLSKGEATVTVFSDELPDGTDLFCEVSSTLISGLPSATAEANILGAPLVLEYDVFHIDGHFIYETVLLLILAILLVIGAWCLIYCSNVYKEHELLYWLAVAVIFIVVSIRNPYASFYGEPRSEACYEFWYKAENMGLFGSMMSLMSGEALAWWERILMWLANTISSRKYVFVTAQLLELAWISFVTALPCRRTFRRYFSDEVRLVISILFGTALLFDSAYYFWSCSYWALFFVLMFPLLELDKMSIRKYWAGIMLVGILCVSRIYSILFIPIAVVAVLVLRQTMTLRYRIYCWVVAVASTFEVCYSLLHGIGGSGNVFQNVLDIGLWRMIGNTLYWQLQTINSLFTGASHWQGSGANLLSGLFLICILILFIGLICNKDWAKVCWLGGLGFISLGSIAINVYTSGSHAEVSFPLNYASIVNWGDTVYQQADLHFSYAYICLVCICLTLVYWIKKPISEYIRLISRAEAEQAVIEKVWSIFGVMISVLCCTIAGYSVKARLDYDRIVVEWKESYHVTENDNYFLAVNDLYGAASISMEQGTDEMIFGVNSEGKLYEWHDGLDAYEQAYPYHEACIGQISSTEEKKIVSVTARRALTNFDVKYVVVLWDRNGVELARIPQVQSERRLWLDFLLEKAVDGVWSITFETEDGFPLYVQDGLQIGYILEE